MTDVEVLQECRLATLEERALSRQIDWLALIGGDGAETVPCVNETGGARILSICEAPDGRILLGTDGNGIVAVKDGAAAGRITKADGLTSGVVRRIVPDESTGVLFIVTGNGLCYMKNNVIRPFFYFPYSDNYDIILDGRAAFIPGSAGVYVVRKDALLSMNTYTVKFLHT